MPPPSARGAATAALPPRVLASPAAVRDAAAGNLHVRVVGVAVRADVPCYDVWRDHS